jgi:hypothetical protein
MPKKAQRFERSSGWSARSGGGVVKKAARTPGGADISEGSRRMADGGKARSATILKKERLIFPFPAIEGGRKLCTRVRSPFRKLPVNADNFERHIQRITHTSGKIARSSCRTGTRQAPFKQNPSAAVAVTGAEEAAAYSSRSAPTSGSTIVAIPATMWCPIWAPPQAAYERFCTCTAEGPARTNVSIDRHLRIQQPNSPNEFPTENHDARIGQPFAIRHGLQQDFEY